MMIIRPLFPLQRLNGDNRVRPQTNREWISLQEKGDRVKCRRFGPTYETFEKRPLLPNLYVRLKF